MTKLLRRGLEHWLVGVKEGEGWEERGRGYKGAPGGSLRGWNVLYLDCVKVTIPAATRYWSCARWYHWGKLDEAYTDLSVFFLITTWEPTVISSKSVKSNHWSSKATSSTMRGNGLDPGGDKAHMTFLGPLDI